MTAAPPVVTRHPARCAMALLAGGVPLALLVDLVLGPCSEDLDAAQREGPAQPSDRGAASGQR